LRAGVQDLPSHMKKRGAPRCHCGEPQEAGVSWLGQAQV
jgi:hypothetical protein